MWRYTGSGEHIGAGVPARDMTDEEFEAVEAAYDAQFPGQEGALRTCGLYAHDAPETTKDAPVAEEDDDG